MNHFIYNYNKGHTRESKMIYLREKPEILNVSRPPGDKTARSLKWQLDAM